jgi:hypothetical protein
MPQWIMFGQVELVIEVGVFHQTTILPQVQVEARQMVSEVEVGTHRKLLQVEVGQMKSEI